MSDNNLDDVMSWINGVVDNIRFDRQGEEQSLGRDLATVVAEEIAANGAEAQAPDGAAWDANEQKYATWKNRRYRVGEHAPNIRTGQMLSRESLLGMTTIGGDAVEMKYGTAKPPTRTATGVELSNADREITDIEKAFFNQNVRPFYMMSESIADACMEAIAPVVARWIEES